MDTEDRLTSEMTLISSETVFEQQHTSFSLNIPEEPIEYPFSFTKQQTEFLIITPESINYPLTPLKTVKAQFNLENVSLEQNCISVPDSFLSEIQEQEQILFRDAERLFISNYVKKALSLDSIQPLHISGFSGTGKTSVVMAVYSEIVQAHQQGASVIPVYLNLMRIPSNYKIFEILAIAVLCRSFGDDDIEMLDSHFSSNQEKSHVVLFVDEVHQIAASKINAVIYSLGEWSSSPCSRLVLVFISNIVNLSKEFPSKINSRINLETLNFNCFSKEELFQIIKQKYCADALFSEEALTLFSSKLGAFTSDIRTAENFLKKIKRRHKGMDKIQVNEVEKVFKTFGNKDSVLYLTSLSQLKKLVLGAVVLFNREYGHANPTLDSLFEAVNRLLKKIYCKDEDKFTWTTYISALKQLSLTKVVKLVDRTGLQFDSSLIFDFLNCLQEGALKETLTNI